MSMHEHRLLTIAEDLRGMAATITDQDDIPRRALDLVGRECGLEFRMDAAGRAKMATVILAGELMVSALATLTRAERKKNEAIAAQQAAALEAARNEGGNAAN